MVLGYSLLPIGMGLMFQSLGMVLSVTPLALIVSIYILKTLEEPRLIERFGKEYTVYRKKTPFLLPNWIKLFRDYLIPYITEHWNQIIYIFLSELSLLIVTSIVFKQNSALYSFSLQEITSSVFFALICVFGIIAGISPKWLSFGSRSERHGSKGVTGHHPDCGRFSGHVVRFMDKNYCAGCSGLVLGAFTAIAGLLISLYGLFTFDPILVFWIGALFVSLGLAQHLIDLGSSWIHFWLNFWFVLGAWFMFESIQQLNNSFLVTLYFLTLTVFWIYARIRVSQFTHVSTCDDCIDVCMLRFE
jgi:protein-S-isoprenylcysteine O-methyltransferase Ste14